MDLEKEFGKQFTPETDKDKAREAIRDSIMVLAESWPEFLASWNGMYAQTVAEGWTPEESRAIVLQAIMPDPTYLVLAHRNIDG